MKIEFFSKSSGISKFWKIISSDLIAYGFVNYLCGFEYIDLNVFFQTRLLKFTMLLIFDFTLNWWRHFPAKNRDIEVLFTCEIWSSSNYIVKSYSKSRSKGRFQYCSSPACLFRKYILCILSQQELGLPVVTLRTSSKKAYELVYSWYFFWIIFTAISLHNIIKFRSLLMGASMSYNGSSLRTILLQPVPRWGYFI